MSLRKIAGLLAAVGLAVGLIGSGVGAVFVDQVTATQNIDVGTFGCKIVSATTARRRRIAGDGKSVTYTSPTITSSAPGNAPFSFTVKNTGSIPGRSRSRRTRPGISAVHEHPGHADRRVP